MEEVGSIELPVNYNDISRVRRRLVREEYVKRQNGLCYHCGKPLAGAPAPGIIFMDIDKELFPEGFFNWPVHLHHDHNTGMTIGAVHCYCNAVLWQYHDE